MNNLIPNEDNKTDIQVDAGQGTVVSMQTIQHLYNEITGRTEDLSRTYKINHCTSFDNIKQLNTKILQLYEQYNIVSNNTSITLYHVDDQKQTFSSFERFEFYDRTTTSPVENIRIEYNFLIILPKQKKPQSYTIEINIQSRAALSLRSKQESGLQADFLFDILGDRTASIEIKYIDYTVARNFQTAIDQWFKALDCKKSMPCINLIKRATSDLSAVFRIFGGAIFLFVCLKNRSELLGKTASQDDLFLVLVVTFGGLFLGNIILDRFGNYSSKAIKKIRPISYLKLTKGDENAISELCNENKIIITKGLLGLIGAILINIFCTWLALKIGLNP